MFAGNLGDRHNYVNNHRGGGTLNGVIAGNIVTWAQHVSNVVTLSRSSLFYCLYWSAVSGKGGAT